MTDEQRELNRKVLCAIDTFQTEINFLRHEQAKLHGDDDLTFADLLESATNIVRELHKDWREHIGDPIIDKQNIIADLLHDLAVDVRSGKIAFEE